uniref:Trypsin-like serine protease n=1 Tax=Epichloe festucae var. lolii TaxID=73839 RepID=A0A0S2I8Y3_EPIFI|nr:trypsin-like serine protease [Epichloe festucae var. lolii]
MRSFLWQSILLGFAAKSTAIFQGAITTDPNAVGVVRLQTGDILVGSGVVIGNGRCVITAAHVVKGLSERNLSVYKNKVEQGKITPTNDWVGASKINIPSQYQGTSNPQEEPSAYDFAVVELASAMATSPWKVSQTRGGALDLTMYGWGNISRNPPDPNMYPDELRSAVNKNSNIQGPECKDWKNFVGAICVMSSKPNSVGRPSAEGLNCDGDSGGPNVANGHVIGVTSGKNYACGYQTAGLLAGVSGSNQEAFMRQYQSTCGFQFGSP